MCRWDWWGRLRCICGAYELKGSAGREEERLPVACSPKSARRATGNGRAPGAGEEGLVGVSMVVDAAYRTDGVRRDIVAAEADDAGDMAE